MQTHAVNAGSTIQGATAAGTTRRGVDTLSSEDFFKLMISELKQQDPLEPAKTADMIGQVSQIRSIELSGKLADTLETLSRQQRTTGMADLLGKYVRATIVGEDGAATNREGVVTGVRFNSDGSAILELDTGDAVPASAVTGVTTVDMAAALNSKDGAQGAGAAGAESASAAGNGSQAISNSGGPAADKSGATGKQRGPLAEARRHPWYTLGGLLNL